MNCHVVAISFLRFPMWFSLLVIVLYFIQIVDVVVFVFVFNSLAEQPRIVSIVVIVDESVYGVTNRTSWVEESWLNLTWTVNDEPTDRPLATRTFYTYYNSTELFFLQIKKSNQSNNQITLLMMKKIERIYARYIISHIIQPTIWVKESI